MQEPNYPEDTAVMEFTQADRNKVQEVLEDVIEELSDSYNLKGMFAPYANIVWKVLTDPDIEQNRADRQANIESQDKPI